MGTHINRLEVILIFNIEHNANNFNPVTKIVYPPIPGRKQKMDIALIYSDWKNCAYRRNV